LSNKTKHKLETYRGIDSFYTRMSYTHTLGKYHTDRWMKARAWLVANDPGYIWAD